MILMLSAKHINDAIWVYHRIRTASDISSARGDMVAPRVYWGVVVYFYYIWDGRTPIPDRRTIRCVPDEPIINMMSANIELHKRDFMFRCAVVAATAAFRPFRYQCHKKQVQNIYHIVWYVCLIRNTLVRLWTILFVRQTDNVNENNFGKC